MLWRRCTRTRPWPRPCSRRRSSRAARGSTSSDAARGRFSGTGRVRTRARVAGGAGRTAAGRWARRAPPPRTPARLHPGPGRRCALSRRGGSERGAGLPRAPRWPGHLPRARAAGGLPDRRPARLPARPALVPRHARGDPHRCARRARRRGGAPRGTPGRVGRRAQDRLDRHRAPPLGRLAWLCTERRARRERLRTDHPLWHHGDRDDVGGARGRAERDGGRPSGGPGSLRRRLRLRGMETARGARARRGDAPVSTVIARRHPPWLKVRAPGGPEFAETMATVPRLGLRHVVVTSVNRDDLADGGAAHFAATVRAIKRLLPGCRVEVLVPDFQGNLASVAEVVASPIDVFNHNLETVPRLYRRVRAGARYARSLAVLEAAHRGRERLLTKTGLMLGLGETQEELASVFKDLRSIGCDILTLGQYLRPSGEHLPVERYVPPEEFTAFGAEALALGFRHVEAGPLVRSSYHAWSHVPPAKNL